MTDLGPEPFPTSLKWRICIRNHCESFCFCFNPPTFSDLKSVVFSDSSPLYSISSDPTFLDPSPPRGGARQLLPRGGARHPRSCQLDCLGSSEAECPVVFSHYSSQNPTFFGPFPWELLGTPEAGARHPRSCQLESSEAARPPAADRAARRIPGGARLHSVPHRHSN